MSTALYLLRCKQLGLRFEELDMIECGIVYDMMTESGNDEYDYPLKAGQEQFRDFMRG